MPFVLLEGKFTNRTQVGPGTGRYDHVADVNQYAWVAPENVHKSLPKLLSVVMNMLTSHGYDPRYGKPGEQAGDCLFLADTRAPFQLMTCRRNRGVQDIRLIIESTESVKSKPETEIQKWKAEMPDTKAFAHPGRFDQNGYNEAVAQWLQRIPE